MAERLDSLGHEFSDVRANALMSTNEARERVSLGELEVERDCSASI